MEDCQCIVPLGLPYAISLQYQSKPPITTVSPVGLQLGKHSVVKIADFFAVFNGYIYIALGTATWQQRKQEYFHLLMHLLQHDSYSGTFKDWV